MEKLEKLRIIRKVEMFNGHPVEVLVPNRRSTDEEFKRGLKETSKLFDKVIARKKLEKELTNRDKPMKS